MKKVTVIVLVLVMMLALAACNETPATQTPGESVAQTQGAGTTEAPAETDVSTTAGTEESEDAFFFTFSEVKLIPGAVFDSAAIPEASNVTEVPSCAFEGTDNAYNYEDFELTAFKDGTNEVIYSIYLLDPNTSTDEGLYLGDTLERAVEIYGSDYTENGTEIIYTRGQTQLILITQDGSVISIEYRMAG